MLTYKTLRVYQLSYELACEIHRFSLLLPRYLQYDIADQLRRASRSVPSNIAEGYGRSESIKTTYHFLKIALGSNEEVLFNLKFMKDCKIGDATTVNNFLNRYDQLGRQLNALIRHTSLLVD